jgi:hypothetical protein
MHTKKQKKTVVLWCSVEGKKENAEGAKQNGFTTQREEDR